MKWPSRLDIGLWFMLIITILTFFLVEHYFDVPSARRDHYASDYGYE